MCSRRPLRVSYQRPIVRWIDRLVKAGPAVLRFVAATTSVAMLLPAGLDTQELGTIAGTVVATDARPIAQAQVKLAGGEHVVLTGIDGEFRVTKLAAGRHILEVRRVGYAMAALAVDVEAGVTSGVRIALFVEAAALPTVEITARSGLTPGLRSFYDRRARGAGHFFTQEEIAGLHSRVVTDVLRRVPGVQIQSVAGPYETSNVVRMGRATGGLGARPCPVLFYLNGAPFPLARDLSINDFLAPDDIEAMEVYTGASRIPPQFASNMHNSRCGVIAIWTRVGTQGRKSPEGPSKSDSSARSRH